MLSSDFCNHHKNGASTTSISFFSLNCCWHVVFLCAMISFQHCCKHFQSIVALAILLVITIISGWGDPGTRFRQRWLKPWQVALQTSKLLVKMKRPEHKDIQNRSSLDGRILVLFPSTNQLPTINLSWNAGRVQTTYEHHKKKAAADHQAETIRNLQQHRSEPNTTGCCRFTLQARADGVGWCQTPSPQGLVGPRWFSETPIGPPSQAGFWERANKGKRTCQRNHEVGRLIYSFSLGTIILLNRMTRYQEFKTCECVVLLI